VEQALARVQTNKIATFLIIGVKVRSESNIIYSPVVQSSAAGAVRRCDVPIKGFRVGNLLFELEQIAFFFCWNVNIPPQSCCDQAIFLNKKSCRVVI
jgi:hypothetical protein